MWYNVDYANLLLIKATTREGAERRSHLLHMRDSVNIKNVQVFTSKAKMLISLCDDHQTYWRKKERNEYIQEQRERFTNMCQEDFENYIKTEDFDDRNEEVDFKALIIEMKVTFWFKARKGKFKKIKPQEMKEKIEEIYKIKEQNEITRSVLESSNPGHKFSDWSDKQLSRMRDYVKSNEITRENWRYHGVNCKFSEELLSQMRFSCYDVELNEITRETLKDQITKLKMEIKTEQQQQQQQQQQSPITIALGNLIMI